MPQSAEKTATIVRANIPPGVFNRSKKLVISIPITNTGTVPAEDVMVLDVRLDSMRSSNLALPWPVGDVAPRTTNGIAAGFSLDGLAVGEKHSVAVKGIYLCNSITIPFTLDIPIVIPEPEPKTAFPLMGSKVEVTVDINGALWTYTVTNEEATGSELSINTFQLRIAAPFTVPGTPRGWSLQTDNRSFALWHVNASSGTAIAPGTSLGGFQIQSSRRTSEGAAYSLLSWNLKTNKSGLIGLGTIHIPARK